MQRINSVMLIYKNDHRVEYQYLAELLRLMGIYVAEYMIQQEDISAADEIWSDKDFSLRFNISKYLEESDQDRIEALIGALKEAMETLDVDNLFLESYSALAEIYRNNNLLQSCVTLQYYRKRIDPESGYADIYKKISENFVNAIDAIEQLDQNKKNCCNVQYALLFCKQKANLALYLCRQPIYIYIDQFGDEIFELIDRNPDFSNAWVLLGLAYDISRIHSEETIDAYERAIKAENEQPYVSSIYYWLGKKCEELSLTNRIELAYGNAYRIQPKYRNMYKMATIQLNHENWDKAIAYYNECIEFLSKKGKFLDPLEQEYYYKVHMHLAYAYLKKDDYYNAICSVNEGLFFKNKIESEFVKFYYCVYGDDCKDYINLTLELLPEKQAYHYLSEAYSMANMQEESFKYWKMSQEV